MAYLESMGQSSSSGSNVGIPQTTPAPPQQPKENNSQLELVKLDGIIKNKDWGAVVVAQLAEWLLLIPEVRCSNPVISNFY